MLQDLATDHRNQSAYADRWTRAAMTMAQAWRIRTADPPPAGAARRRRPSTTPADWPCAVTHMVTALRGRLASRARRTNGVGGTAARGWAYWAAERAIVTARRQARARVR